MLASIAKRERFRPQVKVISTEYTDIYVVQNVDVNPDERNQDQAESR